MGNSLGGLVLEVLDQVKSSETGFEESLSDSLDPSWDGRREHEALEVLEAGTLNGVHDLFNIFLETEVEHLIGLVEDGIPQRGEVKVASPHVVNDATTGADENVDSASQLVSLIVHTGASVDGQNVVLLLIILQCCEFFGNLDGKFASRGQNHGLWSALAKKTLAAEARHDWQAEAQGLARTSKVSHNHVFFVFNFPESIILDGEELGDTAFDESFDSLGINFREVLEVTGIVSSARLCRLNNGFGFSAY